MTERAIKMERLVQAGKIEEVYYARLLPGEDILQAIYEICDKYDIKTGVILQYAPYIAILAVVVIGAILLIVRRRRKDD